MKIDAVTYAGSFQEVQNRKREYMQEAEGVMQEAHNNTDNETSEDKSEKSFPDMFSETGRVRAMNIFLEKHKMSGTEIPYEYLADEHGEIHYNGVEFRCDREKGALCLGDISDPDKVLRIPLSGGGCLMVNRDNIGSLAKAIGLFSPEDVKRIMHAIAQDNQCKGKLKEIEDMLNGDIESKEVSGEMQESYFAESAREVRNAWKDTMEETGINGFGLNEKGLLKLLEKKSISDMIRIEKYQYTEERKFHDEESKKMGGGVISSGPYGRGNTGVWRTDREPAGY